MVNRKKIGKAKKTRRALSQELLITDIGVEAYDKEHFEISQVRRTSCIRNRRAHFFPQAMRLEEEEN